MPQPSLSRHRVWGLLCSLGPLLLSSFAPLLLCSCAHAPGVRIPRSSHLCSRWPGADCKEVVAREQRPLCSCGRDCVQDPGGFQLAVGGRGKWASGQARAWGRGPASSLAGWPQQGGSSGPTPTRSALGSGGNTGRRPLSSGVSTSRTLTCGTRPLRMISDSESSKALGLPRKELSEVASSQGADEAATLQGHSGESGGMLTRGVRSGRLGMPPLSCRR